MADTETRVTGSIQTIPTEYTYIMDRYRADRQRLSSYIEARIVCLEVETEG